MDRRTALLTIAITVATTSIAAATELPLRPVRPEGWIGRAYPGFGYAWDTGADTCRLRGRMFDGGFTLMHDIAPGVFIGGATTLMFNTLPADGLCGSDGARLAFVAVAGPSFDWYPSERHGAHVFALAGYAEIDPDRNAVDQRGRGVGGTVGAGYEWRISYNREVTVLVGVQLQLTTLRTWSGPIEHTVTSPALVGTFTFD